MYYEEKMDFLKGEIKHISGYKFTKCEKVRFFRKLEEYPVMIIGGRLIEPKENDTIIRHGSMTRRVSQVNPDDVLDPFNMTSSFYDEVQIADDSFAGNGKFDKNMEVKKIREFLASDYEDDSDD